MLPRFNFAFCLVFASSQCLFAEEPLPKGAVKRLGSSAFKWNGSVVDVSSDGKLILAKESDKSVFGLIDAKTGTLLRRFEPKTEGNAKFAQFSADDASILIAVDNKIELLQISGWNLLKQIDLDQDFPTSLHGISRSGAFLVISKSENEAGRIEVLDFASQKCIQSASAPLCSDECLYAFSPDESMIAIRTADPKDASGRYQPDGWIHVLDLKRQKLVARIQTHSNEIKAMAFSHDGKRLAVCDMMRTLLCDLTKGKIEKTWPVSQHGQTFASFSHDDRNLVTISAGFIHNWDLKVGKRTSKRVSKSYEEAAWTGLRTLSDDRLLGWRTRDKSIELWNIAKANPINLSVGHVGSVKSLAFQPSGRIVSSSDLQMPLAWNAETGEAKEIPRDPSFDDEKPDSERKFAAAAFSSGGRYAFISVANPPQFRFPGGRNRSLWDLAESRFVCEDWGFADNGGERERQFSPDERYVALFEFSNGDHRSRILIFDLEEGEPIPALTTNGYCTALAFSPDNRLLAAIEHGHGDDSSTRLVVWEISSGKEVFRIAVNDEDSFVPAFLDDRWIALFHVGFYDRMPEANSVVFDVRTGQQVGGLAEPLAPGHPQAPAPVLSPDRRVMAFATSKGIAIVETATWAIRKTFAIDIPVYSLAFSRDGKTLASGMEDTTILLWDLLETPAALDARNVWQRLGSVNAEIGWGAVSELCTNPETALEIVRKNLRAVPEPPKPDVKRLQHCITRLDSEKFIERERAMTELQRSGAAALPIVEKAIAAKPAPEAAKRLETIRENLRQPECVLRYLAELRAIETLERIGSKDAIAHLEIIAKGFDSPITTAAKASAKRLAAK